MLFQFSKYSLLNRSEDFIPEVELISIMINYFINRKLSQLNGCLHNEGNRNG
jgi:hypothetical protein